MSMLMFVCVFFLFLPKIKTPANKIYICFGFSCENVIRLLLLKKSLDIIFILIIRKKQKEKEKEEKFY